MPVRKRLSDKLVSKDDMEDALNREVIPVLRETRSVLNNLLSSTSLSDTDVTITSEFSLHILSSATAVNATLPDAEDNEGVILVLKNVGAGVVTLLTVDSQTIDQNASGALTMAQWARYTLRSDGANWLIV